MLRKSVFIAALLIAFSNVCLAERLDGFAGHSWGSSRAAIIGAEGHPSVISDFNGAAMYLAKQVGGFSADINFTFEIGCTSLKSSICRLSAGFYNFKEPSRKKLDKLRADLTEKYGQPTKTEKEKREDERADRTKIIWRLEDTELWLIYFIQNESRKKGGKTYGPGELSSILVAYNGPYVIKQRETSAAEKSL